MVSMLSIPSGPAVTVASGQGTPRYEDICQDGRVRLSAFPRVAGPLFWNALPQAFPGFPELRKQGVLALLSRATLRGTESPVPVGTPLDVTARGNLFHTRDTGGAVDRLMLVGHAELRGPAGRSFGPRPEHHGTPAVVGTMIMEHVFTRPYAPPEQRKVKELDAPGLPRVPEAEYPFRPPESALALPPDAVLLEDDYRPDPASVVFGLDHTDSNQHINSLVYPRLFEEAALRRFAELGRDTRVLARAGDIAYRKPCFAGQVMHIALRAFAVDSGVGAAGYFVGHDQLAEASSPNRARPHCFVQMVFSP